MQLAVAFWPGAADADQRFRPERGSRVLVSDVAEIVRLTGGLRVKDPADEGPAASLRLVIERAQSGETPLEPTRLDEAVLEPRSHGVAIRPISGHRASSGKIAPRPSRSRFSHATPTPATAAQRAANQTPRGNTRAAPASAPETTATST